MGLRLDLRQIVYVLSDALDLVGVDDVSHGKRVAFMARRVGEGLGLPETLLDRLVLAGLFHDCGVSSTREHDSIQNSVDWGGDDGHCRRGEALVATFPPLASLGPVIRWHHTNATDLDRIDAPHEALLMANLVYLADRVDVLASAVQNQDVLLERDGILKRICEFRGTRFRTDAVDVLMDVASHEAFWLMQEPRALGPYLGRLARRREDREMTVVELRQLASIFATIVDAKSPFTAEHSLRVAAVARTLAGAAGLPAERCGQVEVAALLHDIGKLRVPDGVLDKPGVLDGNERVRITRHAFDTWQILSRIDGFEELARWASYHHEWVKGGGYPFGLDGRDLCLEARLVAVSDVFQALRQDRPYRGRMPLANAMDHVDAMVVSGKLDGDMVKLVHREIEGCEAAATGG